MAIGVGVYVAVDVGVGVGVAVDVESGAGLAVGVDIEVRVAVEVQVCVAVGVREWWSGRESDLGPSSSGLAVHPHQKAGDWHKSLVDGVRRQVEYFQGGGPQKNCGIRLTKDYGDNSAGAIDS